MGYTKYTNLKMIVTNISRFSSNWTFLTVRKTTGGAIRWHSLRGHGHRDIETCTGSPIKTPDYINANTTDSTNISFTESHEQKMAKARVMRGLRRIAQVKSHASLDMCPNC
jgi:hypothetical protein